MLKGPGSHQEAEGFLDRPTVIHEAGCEVVQEFRVGGFFPEATEVVDRADQTPAKEMMPEAVDHHSRRQGIGRTGDLVGQFQPATERSSERLIVEHLQESARHRLARLGDLASHKHRLVERDRFVDSRCAPRDGNLRFQPAIRGHGLVQSGQSFERSRQQVLTHKIIEKAVFFLTQRTFPPVLDSRGQAAAVEISQLVAGPGHFSGSQEEGRGFDEFFGGQRARVKHHLRGPEMSAPTLCRA